MLGIIVAKKNNYRTKMPLQLIDKVVNFIMKPRKLHYKHNYELSAIANMPCSMDIAGNTTIA